MIVSIDTSSAISVTVTDAKAADVVAARSEFSPRGHAELLSGLVSAAMSDAGVARTDVTVVVVGTGPAPFTGLRVGLVTARMLALAWQVPLLGVCSLDALGAKHRDALVLGDARRREVYWARYRAGGRIAGPAVTAPADVQVEPGETLVGRGGVLYPDAFPGAIEADPDPLWLAREALRRRAAGEELPTEPLYLRRPDVHQA